MRVLERMLRYGQLACLFALLCGCTSSTLPSLPTANLAWAATRTVDPITDEKRCVVARYDQRGWARYSRTGYLYPVVEMHPEHGLVVGVSSGGTIRVPVGDVVWRVDQRPHRTISAKSTPLDGAARQTVDSQLSAAVSAEHAEALENAVRATMGVLSTTTLATGDQAEDMLAEMIAGAELLFRTQVQNLGLPDARAGNVGEMRDGAQEAIPLDETFRAALGECGIR